MSDENKKDEPRAQADNNGIAIGSIFVGGDLSGSIQIGNVYHNYVHQLTPAAKQEIANLKILLDKVKTFWVKGVLEKSLDQAVLIDLVKETQNQAVDHPWSSTVELPDNTSQVIQPGTHILDLFDQANHALLILGEPGAGKTTTLLELTRALIERAENDAQFSQPIPVVFKLSSWSNQRKPILEWMVEELSKGYQVNKRVGKPWLEQNRLLPLFDGLDEVNAEQRAACVKAINEFEEAYGLCGLVVSCRLAEYTALPVRLKMNAAICLQKLTSAQINTYLSAAGENLTALQSAIQNDEALQALAQSPLMLNVMCLAYHGVAVDELTSGAKESIEKRRGRIFDTYIDRMFKRRGSGQQPYTREQTMNWLTWFAAGMSQHNQSVFLIEGLQPSWLPNKPQRWGYILLSRILTMTVFAFAYWAIGLTLNSLSAIRLMKFLFNVALSGFVWGTSVGFIDAMRMNILIPKGLLTAIYWQKSLYRILNVLIVGLFMGFIISAHMQILSIFNDTPTDKFIFAFLSIDIGLILGLLFGVRGSRQILTNDIQTMESIGWSWSGALKGAGLGYVLASIFGTILAYIASPDIKFDILLTLLVCCVTGFGGIPFGLIFGGITTRILETKTYPNQGIRLSVKNAFIFALIGLVCIFLSFGYLFLFYKGAVDLFLKVVFYMCFQIGISFSLWYGGADAIQHYILRFFLWRAKRMPVNYTHFLDYASELIFLRKVGGGYIFIHRMLQEHLAGMNGK